ncbi:MAG: hypothetical protein ABH872_07790 [Candidatus Omnitrophota bacterium]
MTNTGHPTPNTVRILCLLSVACCLWPVFAFCAEDIIPVTIDGDEVSYDNNKGSVIAKGNVHMKYEDTELFCNEAEYSTRSHIANIKGDVTLKRLDGVIKGTDVVYDFNTQTAKLESMTMKSTPFYGAAPFAHKAEDNSYNFENGYLTTCDLENPHYRLTAKKITVYPKVKTIARGVTFRIGKIPVFYIPYYSHSLADEHFPVQIFPGQYKYWGKYLFTSWRYNTKDYTNRGKVHFDWYERRGFATGITHKWESPKFGEALINLYSLNDNLYKSEKRNSMFENYYPERAGEPSKYLENNRYKSQLSYVWDPNERLSVKGEFHKFSDKYFMRDFFYREYEVEPHPMSYLLVDYNSDYSSMSFLTRKRANRFFTETEYLPQLEYNFFQQRLGNSSLYFGSESSAGNLTYKREYSGTDDDSVRVHSHNTLSYVKNIKWLYVNPYAGSYTTFYTNNAFGREHILRNALETGTSLSTKLYKMFNANINLLGINVRQMRHVVTPTLQYTYRHDPTVASENLFQFDDIDSLERQESAVFTLYNKLQAKNDKRKWDFLYFSPSVEYMIHEEAKGSYFTRIYSDLEIYPTDWLSLNSDIEYSIPTRRISFFNIDMTLRDPGPKDLFKLTLGHRYLRQSSSQAVIGFEHRLTPKISFEHYLRYEYNTGDFKERYHNMRIDLHCWWLDFGVNIKKQREGIKEHAFLVTFTPKAFPGNRIEIDHNYNDAKHVY